MLDCLVRWYCVLQSMSYIALNEYNYWFYRWHIRILPQPQKSRKGGYPGPPPILEDMPAIAKITSVFQGIPEYSSLMLQLGMTIVPYTG